MEDTEGPVNFYDISAPYGEFSNKSLSPFQDGKFTYPANEHYFQSKKFEGTEKEEYIIQAPTTKEAYNRGNERTIPLRADWEQVKEQVMKNGLRLKFNQHPKLRQMLL